MPGDPWPAPGFWLVAPSHCIQLTVIHRKGLECPWPSVWKPSIASMICRAARVGSSRWRTLAIRPGLAVEKIARLVALRLLAKRRMRFQFLDMPIHRGGFLVEKLADGMCEARIGDPMGGPRRRGQHAARHLVHPLRAAFEAGKPVHDAIFDALHVAGRAMQSRGEFLPASVQAKH